MSQHHHDILWWQQQQQQSYEITEPMSRKGAQKYLLETVAKFIEDYIKNESNPNVYCTPDYRVFNNGKLIGVKIYNLEHIDITQIHHDLESFYDKNTGIYENFQQLFLTAEILSDAYQLTLNVDKYMNGMKHLSNNDITSQPQPPQQQHTNTFNVSSNDKKNIKKDPYTMTLWFLLLMILFCSTLTIFYNRVYIGEILIAILTNLIKSSNDTTKDML